MVNSLPTIGCILLSTRAQCGVLTLPAHPEAAQHYAAITRTAA
jgi:hypothetical protein